MIKPSLLSPLSPIIASFTPVFSFNVPEEINRRIVDHTADINLTYSSIAREYLISEGLPKDQIIKTGSPIYEVLSFYKQKIEASEILSSLHLEKRNFYLVSAHREENIDTDKNFLKLVEVLNSVAEKHNLPVILSTHPRTQKRIEEKQIKFHPLLKNFLKNTPIEIGF